MPYDDDNLNEENKDRNEQEQVNNLTPVTDDKEKNAISADLIRGHINTIILRTMYEEDKYGYQIMQEIEEKSRGQYTLKQPTLYSALKRLESQGYVMSYWKAEDVTSGGRRKYFTLTDSGRHVIEVNLAEWEYSRSVIDSLISDQPYDFTKPAPSPVDFNLLKKSTSRIPRAKGEGDDEIISVDDMDENEYADGREYSVSPDQYAVILATEQARAEAEMKANEQFNEQITTLSEEKTRLENELLTATAEAEKLRNEAEQREAEYNEERSRLQSEHETKLEETEQQANEAKERAAKEIEYRERIESEFSEKLEEANRMLDEATQKASIENEEKQQLQEEKQQLQNELLEKNNEINRLASETSYYEELKNQKQQLSDRLDEANCLLVKSEQQNAAKGEEINRLVEEINRLKAEIETVNQKLLLAEQTINTLNTENAKYRDSLVHENYIKLITPTQDDYNGDNAQSRTPTPIYTDKPEPVRDYRNLVNPLYTRTLQNAPMQPAYRTPTQQFTENAPLPTPKQATVTPINFPQSPSYDDLERKAREDGLNVNTPNITSNVTPLSHTGFERTKTMFKSSCIVLLFFIIDFALCLFFKNSLQISYIYPIVIASIGVVQLLVFAFVMFAQIGYSTKRPVSKAYISASVILCILLILLICVIQLVAKIDLNNIAIVLSHMVIPSATTLSIPLFAISYHLFSK